MGAGTALAGLCAAVASAAWADDQPLIENLRGLSIEQLANLQIASVSRRPEALGRAAAAVELITADQIQRSGAQSLPEVLRLARNLEVARVDAQRYAISARGFNSFQASNKLLVLIDGRSVYTPLYSGVFWDQQHVPLQDIERIEVISGPGGTLWGANAVNGVINIITRSAADTQGFSAEAFAGDVDQRIDARYGAVIGGVATRFVASGYQLGPMLTLSGAEANDDWGGAQIGFRSDWGADANSFMLQGSAYRDEFDAGGTSDGGHLLGLWTRQLDDAGSLQVQAYYSLAQRDTAFAVGITDELETWDISAQHNFSLGERHQIVWGGGYRLADSEFVNTANIFTFLQPRRTLRTYNVFMQDEIALTDNIALTLGLKLEDHSFTDLEYMPNIRVAWRPNDDQMVWAAVSRAVRTPSRIDYELQAPGIIIPGSFVSEELLAYELGYRGQPTSNTALSATLFFHDYENLRTSSLTPPGVLPARVGNDLEGEAYGLELWSDIGVTEDWRLSAGLTLLEQDFRTGPFASDVNGSGDDPRYQVFLRSHHNLAPDWSLDLDLRSIDEARPDVPGYSELNARLGWRITDAVEIALSGRNLLDGAHPESFDNPPFEQAPRTVQISARVTY
jgi:iron complex outermembrane receptor protein